jgi:hypothetical protein
MGVGRRTKLGGTAAEYLTLCLHLGMDFQPYHGFKFHNIIQLNSFIVQDVPEIAEQGQNAQ